jgi:D-tyrosyl-tRNA(Tyr) deacylase
MKAVIQRVRETSLSVDGREVCRIPYGLAVYLGVGVGDEFTAADTIALKISKLRIFEDDNGKMNLSIKDVGGEIMLISQFTLYGDCSHGNRPSFINAERPERANAVYEYCAEKMRSLGLMVKQGIFGADMKISQFNDGPVTIIYEV